MPDAARLPRDRYDAARAFMERDARPLDAALLANALGEAAPEAALVALSAFQNADGGFGNGLEPDTTSPASTAIATSVALRLLARLRARDGRPMVMAALGWLDGAIDRERGVWPIVGPDVELAPHAPWWTWSENMAAQWNGFRFNPTAEILSPLYVFADAAPEGLIGLAEEGMRRTLAETEVIGGAYDLKAAIRLAETDAAPTDLRDELGKLVRRSVPAHDPGDEHAGALELAPRPDGLCADLVADQIEAAIARLIESQQADGGWTPFWDWSFVDAAAWKKARRDWRGWLTREALETLVAWDRVET
ncbi:MAG TPA: hypothetical protein VF770_02390 [Solirubrobacterales bacterium]